MYDIVDIQVAFHTEYFRRKMSMNLRRIAASKVKKVLIVNSDPEILNILEVNMKHANLEVLSARNGREALGKVNTDNPDVILIDNSLPDIEGVELCQKLRTECTHHIPMILIGAKTQKKDRGNNKKIQDQILISFL